MEEGKRLGWMSHHICLYCGQEIKGRYEDCDKYYECECADARKERHISQQIQKLKDSYPRDKFVIREERILYKIEEK